MCILGHHLLPLISAWAAPPPAKQKSARPLHPLQVVDADRESPLPLL